MRHVICAGALVALLLALAAPATAGETMSAAQWREDLRVLDAQVQKLHPLAFHKISKDEFEAAVAALDAKIPSLSDQDVELEMVRLVAMLGEGHSRVSLPGLPDPMSDVSEITPAKDPRLALHRAPVRLYAFSDGLYVVAATAEYRSLIGLRVTEIAGRTAQEALDAVKPLINRDNDMGVRLIAPDLVVVPEALRHVGLSDDLTHVSLTLAKLTGETTKVDLAPLPAGADPKWIDAFAAGRARLPLRLSHPDRNLWFERQADTGTLYVRVNVIQDMPQASVSVFAHDLEREIASRPTERLIVDLRDCHGGDNQLFRGLLLALVRNPSVNRPGVLFVVIGRATFSAAVNATSDLERLGNVLFAGEPTSGAPNSWGDPKRVVLPNSGLIARISTIYWRDTTTDETRPWIAPDLSTPPSSADYLSGRDAALNAIFALPARPSIERLFTGLVDAGADLPTFLRLYYQHKTDPVWALESTEAPMERLGERFLSAKAYTKASLIFRINARDYPSSLSVALAASKRAEKADPGSKDASELVDRLTALQVRP